MSSVEFLFRFPSELEVEWKNNRNYESPFELSNIDSCFEEEDLNLSWLEREKLLRKNKYWFLIFTRSVVLTHRNVHNHSFEMKPKQKQSTSSVFWTWNSLGKSEDVLNALSKFKTTKELVLSHRSATRVECVC